ncbi:TOMM system kinase/cyclase fusion protein [Pseudoalteromonas sp. DL2-H2.2]|uniref:TOMM system kinase/cyclase fusion protein n=1 Tax=Pseudoalteromonas sp. DL2-H2.2 TaxID=2908889 RepID=UPI001F402B29|nr:TOMM system kinase/cyclase fusion protein [Pseudoalteromonas sp. DL2-H2.2]MCF2910538.1 TOMM system kinase/cyclase fusion protein [Pseudoalteromonas sp. DL2-H2.2]
MPLTQFSDPYIQDRFQSTQYELIHKIGEGGFGKVYKAKNKNTDQIVAIKFLALEPHLDEAKKHRYVERFKRETTLSSQLQHPHIVRLLDKGQVDENLLYGVFEYVEGQSLREHLIQEGALDAVDATDIMLQVLDALIHAHKQGIIHRDIKPANIMLTQAGAKTYAKILDFGIGTLSQENRHQDFATLTLTQETLGTPSYSAPEQLRGEPASAKTDIYVWGLVFLECLTGLPAVTGSSIASIYHKQLSDVHIPLPSALLGHPLSGLLRRVLQKNATERVISGQEAFAELNSMNVSNLVGVLADVHAQHGYDDATVVLRTDDPAHPGQQDYTTLTERKQITVMALRLSAKILDENAKDLDVIDTLFKSQRNTCIDIATRFGAYHVGNLADTALFYFGYPVASDNDTRLSARTALDVISELGKRNALMQEAHGVQLNAHIGLHSGIFVTYANAVPEGHIANTAMQLARLAGERQILCTAESRAILEPYSEFDYFDNMQLGMAFEQQAIYNLKGEKRVEAFGFMRGTRHHHKLIGRQSELDKTLSIINNEQQTTRVAHIYGEAGIGKSRLLQEIRANAGKYQHLVAQCLPEHQNNALYPILTLVRYLFNTSNLSNTEVIDLFVSLLNEQDSSLSTETILPILLVWLNIELPEDMQPSSLAPDAQKELLFKGLSALLLSHKFSLSNHKLYIIEDIHWADSTTLEFIHHFAENLSDGSVLISTSRQPKPDSLHDLTLLELELHKLTAKATEDFIEQLFEGKAVSKNVRDILVSRTDGIPLFIEELVDMLKQKALVSEQSGEVNFVSPDKLDQVPSSLRESLQQKLDSLVHAKETAQLAATIGREFEYDLLVAASSLSEDQIQNDLNELIEKDLIIQQRRVENDSYIFKHALVRDAAYGSMSTDHLKGFHKSVADTLIKYFPQKSAQFPLSIAKHFASAELYEEAVNYGNIAIGDLGRISFNFEAIELSSYISSWVDKVQIPQNRAALQLKINNTLLPIRTMFDGWGSHVIHDLANQNISLIESIEEPSHIISMETLKACKEKALWTNLFYFHLQANRQKARLLGEELLEYALNEKNRQFELTTRTLLGQACFFDADFEIAKTHFETVLSLYDEQKDSKLFMEFAIDPYLFSSGNLLCIESLMGAHCKSERYLQLCMRYAKATDNIANIITAYTFGTCMYYVFGSKEKMKQSTQEAFDIYGDKIKSAWVHRYFLIMRDWGHDGYETAEKIVQEELAGGQSGFLSWYEPSLAETYISTKQYEKAINLLSESINRQQQSNEVCILPIALRLLAKATHLQKNTQNQQSEILFEKALTLSREHKTEWLITLIINDMLMLGYGNSELLESQISALKSTNNFNAESVTELLNDNF